MANDISPDVLEGILLFADANPDYPRDDLAATCLTAIDAYGEIDDSPNTPELVIDILYSFYEMD